MFSDKYRNRRLKNCNESNQNCCAKESTISTACSFCKDDQNKEQLHCKIQQCLASNDLSSPTPKAILKLFAENRTLVDSFFHKGLTSFNPSKTYHNGVVLS